MTLMIMTNKLLHQFKQHLKGHLMGRIFVSPVCNVEYRTRIIRYKIYIFVIKRIAFHVFSNSHISDSDFRIRKHVRQDLLSLKIHHDRDHGRLMYGNQIQYTIQ